MVWFAGVDWGSRKHQVCVVDAAGKVVGEREFEHGGAGLSQMADWLLSFATGGEPEVGVAVETPRGPVVESLMERGFVVHSINPEAARPFPGPHLAGGREGRPARCAGAGLGPAHRPTLSAAPGADRPGDHRVAGVVASRRGTYLAGPRRRFDCRLPLTAYGAASVTTVHLNMGIR